ncbi:MAG: hypothetical protein J5680_01320 [Neisseriaceae bacterium]|nr:hypothetical protein [Neisseriaceae bacterium]
MSSFLFVLFSGCLNNNSAVGWAFLPTQFNYFSGCLNVKTFIGWAFLPTKPPR